MDVRRFESVGHRALLGLQVFEIRKPFEVIAQMGNAERSLKTLPTERLCLNIASKASITSRRTCSHSNGIQLGLFSSTALIALHASSARPASNSRWAMSAATLGTVLASPLLRDKRIYVSLSVSNFLQR